MKIASQRGLAVVTGAAGGLGASFASQLAERGFNLLLVDRRRAPLEQICDSLAARHGVNVEPFAADLCKREEVECLADLLEHRGDVELLVNNAGFGTVDYFVDTDPDFLVGMVDVHIIAPTLLTRAVLPGMIERNCGGIINVSSIGAFLHSAGNAQYGSTKNYLAVFSQALREELRGTKVNVQALCPGFVRTEFHAAESMKAFHQCAPAPHLWMSADDVVRCSLRRLGGKRVIVIPGLRFRILGRLAQMPLLQPLMQWITRVPRVPPSTKPASNTLPIGSTEQPAEPRPEPSLSVAKRA